MRRICLLQRGLASLLEEIARKNTFYGILYDLLYLMHVPSLPKLPHDARCEIMTATRGTVSMTGLMLQEPECAKSSSFGSSMEHRIAFRKQQLRCRERRLPHYDTVARCLW